MEDFGKLSVAQLKARCKAAGVAGTGEKPDLVTRMKQVVVGESLKIDGVNPAALKAGVLKKELATRGLPCSLDLETRDELVARLIDALRKAGGGGGDGGGGASGSANGGGGGSAAEPTGVQEDDAIALAVGMAKQVLELAGDAAGILSLLGTPINASSPLAQQRKAYLALSRMLHPDKLGRHFDGATRAFQELVRAFDELTAPPDTVSPSDGKAGGKKAAPAGPALSRSNENCFRTRIFCPRCDAEWATADSGLEKYDYNLMMQGLKLYCCALCLCEFGCVSASHRCPLCTRRFNYHPGEFHTQRTCGNAKCKGSFGFMQYTVPARVEAELRAQLRTEQERRMKSREAVLARLARAQRKAPETVLSEAARLRQAERCFVHALLDACPRCGWEGPRGVAFDELQAHLHGCSDKRAHEAYRRGQARQQEVEQRKAATQTAEEEAQNVAAWQFLGGTVESMWMLTDNALKQQCAQRGLVLEGGGESSGESSGVKRVGKSGGESSGGDGSSSGRGGDATREEMLAAIARHEATREAAAKSSTRRLGHDGSVAEGRPAKRARDATAGSGDGATSGSAPARRLSAESLPSNLHSLSLRQLRAVCAAHGMVPRGTSTAAVIAEIEAALYTGTEAAPMLLE